MQLFHLILDFFCMFLSFHLLIALLKVHIHGKTHILNDLDQLMNPHHHVTNTSLLIPPLIHNQFLVIIHFLILPNATLSFKRGYSHQIQAKSPYLKN